MRKHIVNKDALQRLREARGLVPAELAEQAGISLDLLYRVENGSRQTSMATLGRLAEALGVKPIELLIPIPAGGTTPPRGRRGSALVATEQVAG